MNMTRTFRNISVLYVAAMLLVVSLGSILQMKSFTWGLIGTEVICILLPALVYMRLTKMPIAALRIRWPGGSVALLSLLIGTAIAA